MNPSLLKFVIDGNTAGLQAKLGGQDANFKTLEDGYATLRAQAGTTEANIAADIRLKDANLAYVEGWLSAHDANVGNLQAKQIADEANAAGLQARLAGFDSNFSTLEARQLARDSNFAGIESKIAASDANRATVEALLLIADANVAGVQSKLAALDANASYIEAWLATHDANWASVEIGIRAKDANLADIGALALAASTGSSLDPNVEQTVRVPLPGRHRRRQPDQDGGELGGESIGC